MEQKLKKFNIVAVCAGTKGIGKTWFTVALCHALSLKHKKILFFDADCGLENVAHQTELQKCADYSALFSGALTLNTAVSPFVDGNFTVICSEPGNDAFNLAPIGRAQILAGDLSSFSQYFDFVLMDCSDNNNQNLNPFLHICKNILIIVNANSSSSTEAFKTITKLKKICPEANFHIVVNRASSYEEGRQAFKTLLKASKEYINIKLNLLGIIRRDARIREAAVSHCLILDRYPDCDGAQDCLLLADNFLEKFDEL